MAEGNILVRLFRIKDLLPITNGSIRISNSKIGNIVYEKENAFDISGRSEIISVVTIDRELSQEPYEESGNPYLLYNIEVKSEGYKDVIVEGVSVFDGITSIQDIEMEEASIESGEKNLQEEIIIQDQQGVEKSTENIEMGFSMAPFVLRNVYVPEFITVHLGSPTSYAENITVRFIDYIKNVASSEIYPTWPEEAIRANVYCQISFALNRVYTEWYRNMGYPFQVTNSTAYDQYFVKGRNIFENISKIVDEIFNEYIITIGNQTPFFAQYCNGTTVKCDGLSQWGTVDLAKAGMSALDIIKYYFGYDKVLVRAEYVEGVPESYPGYSLRIGDVNENVKVIQEQLNRVSKNFPAIPRIYPEDGRFGKETEDSVKVFQRVFNLTPDGVVGRATWYKISNIYVGVKRLAELNQEPEIGESGGNGGGIGKPEGDGKYPGYLLKYGARGEKVRELQGYLSEISKSYNIPNVSVDGIFGNGTKDAIIKFQRLFGLSTDGIVGLATWNKVFEVYKNIDNSNPGVPDNEFDGKYPGYLLKYGSRGEKVKEVQYYLASISNQIGIPTVAADGIFGNATREAVVAFQKLFALSLDGIIGQYTWNKILEVYNGMKY
ncbi:peptidoglycan-binding domain-containing protein [Clostridium tertium]|uniref:peptidoglycan-binding domain-containing protein n=1 Tax=Clostridium tertium TaxID=1559 RepID=UPI0018A8B957|nr:peptidoglycan-binding protein [Clostridium tertium]